VAPLPQALPLTTFERIMWYDDHRRLPMTFRLELVFEGLLDRQAFQAAFAAASARHPLLQAVVVRRWGRLCWMPAERSASVIWVDPFSPAPANAWEGIQPWREPGVRIIAAEVPSDEVVVPCTEWSGAQPISQLFHARSSKATAPAQESGPWQQRSDGRCGLPGLRRQRGADVRMPVSADHGGKAAARERRLPNPV
jgi:hypothetical protein